MSSATVFANRDFDDQPALLAMRYLLAVAAMLLLTACTTCEGPPVQAMRYVQPMPDNSSGVRAGCIRTLARLAVDNKTTHLFDIEWAARYCDTIERSFQDELHEQEVLRT